MKRIAFCAAVLAAVTTLGGAQAAELGDIKIDQPWARASAGAAKSGAAFVTLRNGGGAADRLTAASAPIADRTELHTHKKEGDVMRMVEVPAIDLPAGQEVKLAPGGLHVMFMGLKSPLKAGDKFPLTLTFEKAGKITVEVAVQPITSMGGGDSGGHSHGGRMH
ncbi:MAG: copper chaperone PCu(A)C [Rhodospirillales bacterium]